MPQPVGRQPMADRCRRGADRRTRLSFLVAFVYTEMEDARYAAADPASPPCAIVTAYTGRPRRVFEFVIV